MHASDLIIPDIVPYLFAVLTLLLLWEFHEIQVNAGRILAMDIWDRSGIRLFIHITPCDSQTCPACLETSGLAMLPIIAASKKEFTSPRNRCTNPSGCRCLLVGLYGAWPEARALLKRLQSQGTPKPIPLTGPDMTALVRGPWEQSLSAAMDRVSVHMLEAAQEEQSRPETAVFKYQYVIGKAKTDRDLAFVIPAYLRATDLLEQQGRGKDALDLIDRFERTYAPGTRTGRASPAQPQRNVLAARKTRLRTAGA
ncbi:MAG: hypothetical protein KGO52_12930 [Nitrospirota bacterium]|nr:hypothetical protein [Nitrospirota bacterium]MDE3243614.1 hypothetical protein [Nitrospirota bacterium]